MTTMEDARPVICAIEDTAVASRAANAAAWLARAWSAPLVLAHVFDPMGIGVPSARAAASVSVTAEDLEHAARRRASRFLADASRAARGDDVSVEMLEGRPAPALLTLAAARDAKVLVTGTAARAGLDRVLVGSVSSVLAAGAPCPVLVVSETAALEQPGPVLVGYDGSEHSLRAARHSAALAARLDRPLVLMHVVSDREQRVRPDAELADELYAAVGSTLSGGQDRPPLRLEVSVAVEEGDPVQTLGRAGRERGAALIVVGSRGLNVVGGVLLGSVSAGLMAVAEQPVGVVPASAGDSPRV
jgi:nucleotide-binding universal stress UspA family protein